MAWNSIPIRIAARNRKSFRQTEVVAGTGALHLIWNWAKRVNYHASRIRHTFMFRCHRKRSSIFLPGVVVAVAANLFSTGIGAEQVADSMMRCATAAAVWWQGKDGIAFEAIEPERAIRLCEAATREEPGEGEAWAFLARAYNKANRHSEAMEATEKSVELGSVAGLWQLGVLYAYGESIKKDLEQAALWYRKAADQGYAKAQFNLGWSYENGEGVEKDLEQAALWYRKAADQGYAKAQFNLGWSYENGEGVEKDLEQAALWYRKAADQGYAVAQFNLGVLYMNGKGVEKDLEQAALWYRKAADQGDAKAQFNLGWSYDNGKGVEKDLEQAALWYRKAADQGDASAQFNIGAFYLNGKGVEKDLEQAALWYRKAADQGYAVAQFNLGVLYMNGKGVEKDLEQAALWYRKAADQGYASAQINIGAFYLNGKGVEDLEQAALWYRKAAEQGDTDAQNQLGLLYERGEGVEKDLKQAALWYRKAADQGNSRAQFSLGGLYERGEGVEKDRKQATLWWRKAADQGYARAQFNIGWLYERGEGVEKDLKQAAFWYRKAADQGNSRAQFSLGGLYERGEGVEKDLEQAALWWRKAADQGYTDAYYNLGLLYKNGEGVEKDLEQAALWWRKAADQGDGCGQNSLGQLYERGEGVTKNLVNAAFLLRKSAEQGTACGQFNFAKLLERGEGVERNFELAASWYRKSAEQGNAGAQYSLGRLYERGEGVGRNLDKAAFWYGKSAEQGNTDAQIGLGLLYRHGRGVGIEFEQSVTRLLELAEQGDVEAHVNLGRLYERGDGVGRDPEQAAAWYREAAEQGDADAQFNLGVLYEIGEGIEKDLEQAVLWWRKAADQGDAKAQFNLGVLYYNGESVEKDLEQAASLWRKAAEDGDMLNAFGFGDSVDGGLFLDAAVEDFDGQAGAAHLLILAMRQDQSAVPRLMRLLEDKDPTTRGEAVRALGRLGERMAVAPIIARLADDDATVRRQAVLALVESGERSVVGPLIDRLFDSDEQVRVLAAEGLSKLGARRAAEALEERLADDAIPRSVAVPALASFGVGDQFEPDMVADLFNSELVSLQSLHNLADSLIVTSDRRVVPILLDVLKEGSSGAAENIAAVLSRLGGSEVFEPVLTYLDNDGYRAYSALREMGDVAGKGLIAVHERGALKGGLAVAAIDLFARYRVKNAERVLNELFEGQDKYLRDQSLEALAAFGSEHMDDSLVLHMEDLLLRDIPASLNIVELLSERNRPRAVDVLMKNFEGGDADVRERAKEYLVELGDSRTLERLMSLFKRGAGKVKVDAAGALLELGVPEPIFQLLADDDGEIRDWSEELLTFYSGSDGKLPSGAAPLIRAFSDGLILNDDARAVIVAALVEMRQPLAAEKVFELLEYDDPAVRNAGGFALSELGDARAVEPLLEVLNEQSSGLKLQRRRAAVALGMLGDARAVEPLARLLSHDDALVRFAAVSALGELRNSRAVEPLTDLMNGQDEDLQEQAVIALGKLGEVHAVTPIIGLLGNSGGWDGSLGRGKHLRKDVLEVLGKFNEQRAIEALVSLYAGYNEPEVRNVILGLDPLQDKTVWQVLRSRATVSTLLSLVSEAKAYSPGMLFMVQTIAERGAYRQRLQLLERTWSWRYYDAGTSATRIEEHIETLRSFLAESGEQLSPYTLLLAAVLTGGDGDVAAALEWTNQGLSRALDSDAAANLALSILKAESLATLGDLEEAQNVIHRVNSSERNRLIPLERVGYLALLESEAFMTEAYVSSKSDEHQDTIIANYDAESILKTAFRLGWISDDLFERLVWRRIARIQRHALPVEQERYRQPALNSLDAQPRGPQESYARDLALQSQIETALKDGDYNSYDKVRREVERTALAAIPQRSELKFANQDKQKAYEELESKNNEIAGLEKRKQDAEKSFEGSGSQIAEANALRKESRKKQRELNKFITNLKKQYPDIAAMWGKSPTELSQLSDRLNPSAGIVQYLILDKKSYAFVVLHNGLVEMVPLQLDGRDVGRQCPQLEESVKEPDCINLYPKVVKYRVALTGTGRFNKDLREREKAEEELEQLGTELSNLLLSPIAKYIKGLTHLILVPNGSLHRLPFAALPWNEGYLIEYAKLTLLPASSLVGALLADPEDDLRGLLALGNPVPEDPEGWSNLKWAEAEVKALPKYFPELPRERKHILTGEAADLSSLLDKDLEGYLIHIAAHAESGNKTREARLLLTGGDLTYDGVVGLYIENAPLVVLSGCETGLGEVLSGDEVYSLANAFLLAQAKSVVFSLWLLDDPATKALMDEFYGNFREGAAAAALAEAQRAMIRKGSPPAHWAGFVISEWSNARS